MKGMQKEVAELIENAAEVNGEAETNIANLTNLNDELLSCIENCRQTVRKNKAEGAADGRLGENRREAAGRTGANQPENRTVWEARTVIQQFQTLQEQISKSPVIDATQTQNLEVVREQLENLQQKMQELINSSVGDNAGEVG
ncbi:unnamed protein product, partial [Dibothriocephalus latus]